VATAQRGPEAFAVITRLSKAVSTAALLITLVLAGGAVARGQLIRVDKGRRVGRVILPTPPFNPDAPVLDDERGRGRKPREEEAAGGSVRRAGHAGRRRQRQVSPRKVRRYLRAR
jgi:hypothetical protein